MPTYKMHNRLEEEQIHQPLKSEQIDAYSKQTHLLIDQLSLVTEDDKSENVINREKQRLSRELTNEINVNTSLKDSVENSHTDPISRVTNCAVMIGAAMDMLFRQQQVFDVTAYADTLYNDLYANPVELSVGATYFSKIYLQAFFAISEDARIDYTEIERCLAVTGKHESFHTIPFMVCAYSYAEWAEENNLVDKEIAALQLGLKAHDKVFPDSTTMFNHEMHLSLMSIYVNRKEWTSAAKYAEYCLEDCRRTGEEEGDEYYGVMSALALCYQMAGQYSKSDSYMQLVQRHMEQTGATDSEDYNDLLITRAEMLVSLGKYDEAEQMLKKIRQEHRPADDVYQQATMQLVSMYQDYEKYDELMPLIRETLSYYEKNHPEQGRELLGWMSLSNNPLAKGEFQRFVKLLEAMQDGSAENMAVLAYAYCHTNQYDKAAVTTRQMEQAYARLSEEEQDDMDICMRMLYTELNEYDKELALLQKQLDAVKATVGTQHDLYAQMLSLMGEFYSMKGDYYSSLQMFDSCATMAGVSTAVRKKAYEGMAGTYAQMGDYQKSNYYASRLLQQTEDIGQQRSLMALMATNMICELEIRKNDLDEQGRADTDSLRQQVTIVAKRLLDFCRQHYGEGHLNTIEAMEYLAGAYYLTADNERMMQITEECESIIKRHLKNDEMRRNYLQGLAVFYQKNGNYRKALELVDTTCLKSEKPALVELKGTLEPLAEFNLNLGNVEKAQYYFNRLAQAIIGETSGQMMTLTSQARQRYWRLSRHILSGAGKYIRHCGEPDPFAGTIYNMALYTKDCLLGSEQSFVRAIRHTGDETLMEKMQLMMNLRTAVVQSTTMSAEEKNSKIQYAESLEQELLAACRDAQEADAANRVADWRRVQEALPDSALAIEMVQFLTQDDTDCYGAALLRKGWTNPVFVSLGTRSQLDQMDVQDLSRETGNKVWQFVAPYLDGIGAIYFSPIGVFNTIPIEYMPFADHEVMSEAFRIYRLSSTSQLLHTDNDKGEGAVVYGGLDYDISPTQMAKTTPTSRRQRGAGSVEYLEQLEGTAIEADRIVELINSSQGGGMSAELYAGKDGTETSFKALDGQHRRVIHIGTHGFYSADDSKETASSFISNFQQSVNSEDMALRRSGLYFAGANNTLLDEVIPDSIDDGVLTAQEVSTLDLRGLELVTLSACQTAQGRVTGDGVFGLQRGFKKAGANSILMSLWKVDDEATCLLMTEFYRLWMSGITKHDALEQAKRLVRSHTEKGWNAPHYWAAFILLDGVD